MAFNAVNISIPVKFEIKTPPRGMIDYDPKALSIEQQKEINNYKLYVRKENIKYVFRNPELNAVVSMVIRMTAIHQPRNIIEFIAKLFARPERQIREDVTKILNETKMEYEMIPPSDYEDWDY